MCCFDIWAGVLLFSFIIKKEKPSSTPAELEQSTKDSVRAIMMIRAYRIRGHLNADLDPLGLVKKESTPELLPETYGFTNADMDKKIFLDEVLGLKYASLREILDILKRTYCSSIGIEFMHMTDPEEKSWIQQRIEGKDKEIQFTDRGKKAILNKLIESDGFEKYLAKKYVGTKRFGLDGCESLIPAMEQIIKRGGALGCKEVKIGMPHRGRLNILTNPSSLILVICFLYACICNTYVEVIVLGQSLSSSYAPASELTGKGQISWQF